MTPERIEQLKRLLTEATPAPWREDGYRIHGPAMDWPATDATRGADFHLIFKPHIPNSHENEDCLVDGKQFEALDADLKLMVAARNDMPDLLGMVTSLQTELNQALSLLHEREMNSDIPETDLSVTYTVTGKVTDLRVVHLPSGHVATRQNIRSRVRAMQEVLSELEWRLQQDGRND